MAEILNVDFNQLPRAVRERFVAITQNKAGPQPILQQRVSGAGAVGWVLLLLLVGVFFLAVLFAELGEPYAATQPGGVVLVYVLFGFLSLLSILGLIRRSIRRKALPFAAGAYVFPLDVVLARDRSIKLLSAREVRGVEP